MGSRPQERLILPTPIGLNGADISNAVSKQAAFRAAHPVAGTFKLDFAFNGSGAVVDPEAIDTGRKPD